MSPQGIHFLFSPRPADYSPAHPRIRYEKQATWYVGTGSAAGRGWQPAMTGSDGGAAPNMHFAGF